MSDKDDEHRSTASTHWHGIVPQTSERAPTRSSGPTPLVDPGDAPTLVSAPSVGDIPSNGSAGSPAPSDSEPPALDGLGPRYADTGLLGRGGMGEVRLARDQYIGRKVALKVIRSGRANRPRSRARFMREARIQGQLEHPAIVPVYDLAHMPDGRPYFTMKRITGVTLEQVIRSLRADEPQAVEHYSRRRLLEAFARVCLAVDYVHQSGVLHRDLKPGNVMLGQFGEVYLLDWGLVKLFRDNLSTNPDHDLADAADDSLVDGPQPSTLDDYEGGTVVGELMGTPGYMAPEQIDGGQRQIDERADIYALGAVLFELLTYHPLHPSGPVQRKLGSTIQGADARAHQRFPAREVPPELEAICVKATADDPSDRYPTARELADAIEAFLDGDRDLNLRNDMAARWATRANQAAQDAIDSGNLEARSRALGHASRALALNPNDSQARSTFVRLLVEPPRTIPSSAIESLAEAERTTSQVAARGTAIGYCAWLCFFPMILWMGVLNWTMLSALVGCIVVALLASLAAVNHPQPEAWARPLAFLAGIAALLVLGRLCGPLVLVPGLAATNTAAVIVHAPNRRRAFYLVAAAASVVLPLWAEHLGWLPVSYEFRDGVIIIAPQLASLPPAATLAFLITATLTAIVVPPLLLARTRDGLRRAEQRLAIHAWQMEQLLPRTARPLVGRNSEGDLTTIP